VPGFTISDIYLSNMFMSGLGQGNCDCEDRTSRVELDPVALVAGGQAQGPNFLSQERNKTTFAWKQILNFSFKSDIYVL